MSPPKQLPDWLYPMQPSWPTLNWCEQNDRLGRASAAVQAPSWSFINRDGSRACFTWRNTCDPKVWSLPGSLNVSGIFISLHSVHVKTDG